MTRAQAIEKITLEYAQLQRENERDRDERVASARARDPEIARIQAQMAARFSGAARSLLSDRAHGREIARALKEQTLKDQARLAKRLALCGLAPDELSLRPRCGECGDTGYAGGHGAAFCACFEKRLLAVRCESASSAPGHSFEDFDPSVFPTREQREAGEGARRICEQYADGFPGGARPNLVLMGESGLGKTFLLEAIACRVAERGHPALRLTAFRALEAMRAYHFGENGEDALLKQMIDSPILLLDDLGTEPMLRNITVEYLFLLLNERMCARRHTVVATNLTAAQMAERYGERVLSRLLDRSMGEFIRLTGRDLRLGKR